jgi:hypothetical protein
LKRKKNIDFSGPGKTGRYKNRQIDKNCDLLNFDPISTVHIFDLFRCWIIQVTDI